jgi:hypothetical protein
MKPQRNIFIETPEGVTMLSHEPLMRWFTVHRREVDWEAHRIEMIANAANWNIPTGVLERILKQTVV